MNGERDRTEAEGGWQGVSESAVSAKRVGFGLVWRQTGAVRNARPSRGQAASSRKRAVELGYATMIAEAIETKFRTVVEAIAGVSAQFRNRYFPSLMRGRQCLLTAVSVLKLILLIVRTC
jgi:hypothetical protein